MHWRQKSGVPKPLLFTVRRTLSCMLMRFWRSSRGGSQEEMNMATKAAGTVIRLSNLADGLHWLWRGSKREQQLRSFIRGQERPSG